MSIDLAVVAAMYMEHGVTLLRFDSSGAYSTLLCSLHVLEFSADTKRKSAAYDRLGITPDSSLVRVGETQMIRGDVVVSEGRFYIVGEQIPNSSDIAGSTAVENVFELTYCNSRIRVVRVSKSRDSLTQILATTSLEVYSGVPASVNRAQQDYTEEAHTLHPEFQVAIPEALLMQVGDLVSILPFADSNDKFPTDTLMVKYGEPEFLGTKKFRVGANRRAEI